LAPGSLFGLAAGGDVRDPNEGGVDWRPRLRVIGWRAPCAWVQSGGSPPRQRAVVPIANGDLGGKSLSKSECLLTRCHGSGF
jgi:hypothetical protein